MCAYPLHKHLGQPIHKEDGTRDTEKEESRDKYIRNHYSAYSRSRNSSENEYLPAAYIACLGFLGSDS